MRKTKAVGFSNGIGAVEGTCRERSERNSEKRVLAQVNERQPYTYGFHMRQHSAIAQSAKKNKSRWLSQRHWCSRRDL